MGIEQRPAIVGTGSRIGHWEADTIIGKDHKGAMLTLTARKSGYAGIIRLNGKNAKELAEAFIQHQQFLL